jgi:hypothetical protein
MTDFMTDFGLVLAASLSTTSQHLTVPRYRHTCRIRRRAEFEVFRIPISCARAASAQPASSCITTSLSPVDLALASASFGLR